MEIIETGKTKKIIVGNKSYTSCTEFNKNGECSVYDHRPGICREFQCYKMLVGFERRAS
ncbi:MAG: YkgJ family cysteine cluster protein [Nanoarchaeota archaeon]|nr:YkgJ family cysteine cluster protein [Nanoarchaeota archaeon]